MRNERELSTYGPREPPNWDLRALYRCYHVRLVTVGQITVNNKFSGCRTPGSLFFY